MKNPRPEEENIIKDIRNLFRLEKKVKVIKDRILRDIQNFFEQEEKNNYKAIRANNFWSNNYIEYACNSDRNKTLYKRYQEDTTQDIKKILIKLDHI